MEGGGIGPSRYRKPEAVTETSVWKRTKTEKVEWK
jgi:hypothetical protein